MMNVVLCGLTCLESEEFHLLDASMPFEGNPVWPGMDTPESVAEMRWLELWSKHLAARDKTATTTSVLRAAPEFTAA